MFRILLFPDSLYRTTRLCLGVLGYLMKERRFKNSEVTFVPSKFIQPLSKKSRIDIIKFLIENDYIQRFEPDGSDESWYEKLKAQTAKYRKARNLYLLSPKLLNLNEGYLNDKSVERTVSTNLHHLYQQNFNHWAHNYRHISLNVPNDDVWREAIDNSYYYQLMQPGRPESHYIYNIQIAANRYGNITYKDYNIMNFGGEDNAGRVSNIFTTCEPILRGYTSLVDAVEIGIKYSEGVIMADQLLKTFGNNDFSDIFIDEAVAYQEMLDYARRMKLGEPLPPSLELYEPPDEEMYGFRDFQRHYTNYDAYRGNIQSYVFGYDDNESFSQTFPKVWELLYRVKANKRDEEDTKYLFNQFVSNITPWILLDDWRLKTKNQEAYRRGQRFYKVTRLVWILREVEVMRTIWKELKRRGIVFIPILDKVLVSGKFEEVVTRITLKKWREHLDSKIKMFPEVQSH